MATRKEPIEPEWPEEHACPDCGARTYVVIGRNGKEVRVDVDELEYTLGWFGARPMRASFRMPELRHLGGYRLLDPELFLGWGDEPASWQWFCQRVGLADAAATEAPIHSAHWATCSELRDNAVLAKLSSLELEGDATGNPRGKATAAQARIVNLQAQREHDAAPKFAPEPWQEPEDSSAESLPTRATDLPQREIRVDHSGQVLLF